jgi:hypothetical protein
MQRSAVEHIREAVMAARVAAQAGSLDGCDLDDLEEIIAPVEKELSSTHPHPNTLATYLNSLARSLRAEPRARSVVMKLDGAMREAGLPTDWEH